MQQLSSLKKRLDEELEHLASSFAKLRAAQTKFRECLTSIREGVSKKSAGTTARVFVTFNAYGTDGWRRETAFSATDYLSLRARDARGPQPCNGGCWDWIFRGKGMTLYCPWGDGLTELV